MTIQLTAKALKDLKSIPPKDARRILDALNALASLPHAGGLAAAAAQVGVDLTQIRDQKNAFRVRVGNYRAILSASGAMVDVVRVRDRRDAYD